MNVLAGLLLVAVATWVSNWYLRGERAVPGARVELGTIARSG